MCQLRERHANEKCGRLAFCEARPELGEILDLLGLPQLLSSSADEVEMTPAP